jgi:uncharacterized protein (DUF302 family)
MIRTLALGLALGVASQITTAKAADLITVPSPHSVSITMDRLETAVTGAGATVFARIDHEAGAAKVDATLRPTEVLIFGNPALGTPAMQDAQTAGLDLPLRVLAFETESGEVFLAYHPPVSLAETHGFDPAAPYVAKMTGALGKLTSAATAAE